MQNTNVERGQRFVDPLEWEEPYGSSIKEQSHHQSHHNQMRETVQATHALERVRLNKGNWKMEWETWFHPSGVESERLKLKRIQCGYHHHLKEETLLM